MSLVVGTHHRDKDDVAFLPLEPVDGVHGNEMTVGLEELALLDELPQILHLGAVGRDDTHVNLLVEDALAANLDEIILQGVQREESLATVHSAITLAHELLTKVRSLPQPFR